MWSNLFNLRYELGDVRQTRILRQVLCRRQGKMNQASNLTILIILAMSSSLADGHRVSTALTPPPPLGAAESFSVLQIRQERRTDTSLHMIWSQ